MVWIQWYGRAMAEPLLSFATIWAKCDGAERKSHVCVASF
jgi:hypothetical protein